MGRGAEAVEQVYNFIDVFCAHNGFGPSRRQISEGCELPLGVVQGIVVRLASEDRIYYTEAVARSIRPKTKEPV